MLIQMNGGEAGDMLEHANREIARSFDTAARRRYFRSRVITPLRVIDQLLDELEQLNLVGRRRVPMDWDRRLALLLISLPAEVHEVPELRSNISTGRLMDMLYELQDTLLDIKVGPIRRRLREFDRIELGAYDSDLDVA